MNRRHLCRSLLANIPYRGWGDWLGTVTSREIVFRPFEEAREFVRALRLKNREQFAKYCKSDKRAKDIPTEPSRTYGKLWQGWGDWLGTGTVATWQREYLPFREAKEFVQSLGFQRREEWDDYAVSGKKPNNIPAGPWNVYKKEWSGIFDWLGYEEKLWSVGKVKELLRNLIKSGAIYNWDEAVLYSFLLRKGLLNLSDKNRHKDFFKTLIEMARTHDGRSQLEEYVSSPPNIPPPILSVQELGILSGQEVEIPLASNRDLANIGDEKPLDYSNNRSVEQILQQTTILESINVDEEAMQFYVKYSIDELWKLAFIDETKTIQRIKLEGTNGNKFHDTVVDTFLTDYKASKEISVPHTYSFPYPPTLMQLYAAHKIRTLPFFGNFSGTGAGKTLSAVLASRIINARLTLIVCPNDVVGQWSKNVLDIFPDSTVISGKEAFYAFRDERKHLYLVLNYDKFSQEESPNLILALVSKKVDFVILDEIHFTKIRDEEKISIRRHNLDGMLSAIRRKNNDVKVLGLSATPVVNNLREGRSLLEIITGKIFDDIATRPTIPNAVTLYEKLTTISIREIPPYNPPKEHISEVVSELPSIIGLKQLKGNPLAIEQLLTDARIPEIVKNLGERTIIYTEYVKDIIKKLSNAVKEAGFSFALYTGLDHSGLSRFLKGKAQVLIASRPISVGVDGLQHICNRLIINTLPWTNAQYQQLVGRLIRKGQKNDVVHVYIVKASIGGYPYDELKLKRIQFKRTLADCAVDGRLPEKNLVTPQQAAMEAVIWLERLEHGRVSTIVRRDLNIELAPVEIKKRVVKYGDFSRLNNRINNEKSESTHNRMLKDATEWEEYHRQYREARKTWPIIPYEEIVMRIKQLSPRLMIGDFGCGEAKIQSEFGDRVYSFDHIAINNKVTACDMKSTGLPDEAIDIAIFSLSLMGKNWNAYIAEAKRCLATGGYLLVSDTTKSLKGRLSALRDIIKRQGFEIFTDEEKGDFTFIEAREL